MLTSDVEQASNAMMFGTGVTTAAPPRSMPQPSPFPSPSFNNEWTTSPNDRRFLPSPSPTAQPIGPSRGNIYETQPPFQIDPRWNGTLSSNPFDPNYIPPTVGEVPGSLDTQFVGGLESPNIIPSSGGRPPPFVSDPNEDWIGSDETAIPSSGGKPPTFIDDPNQDWIGVDPAAGNNPSLAIDPSVNSRPPTSPGYMTGFGGNMTIGQFLSTPMAYLRLNSGQTYGAQTTERVSGGEIKIGESPAYNSGVPTGPVLHPDLLEAPAAELDTGSVVDGRAVSPEVRGALPVDSLGPGGTIIGFPGYSGMKVVGHDKVTGAPVYRDSNGKLYVPPGTGTPTTGGHWDYGQGRYVENNYAGGAQHNTHAANLMVMASQARPGNPNNIAPFASEGRFLFDPQGDVKQFGGMKVNPANRFNWAGVDVSGAPTLYANPASQKAWNNWLSQQPEYKAWMAARGTKGG